MYEPTDTALLLPPRLTRMQRRVRRRRAAILGLQALPFVALVAMILDRVSGMQVALGVLAASLAAFIVITYRELRRVDDAWMVRRLNLALPVVEDSLDLLLLRDLNSLQQLQRLRIEQRIADSALPELRPSFHWPRLLGLWACCGLVILLLTIAAARHESMRLQETRPAPGTGSVLEAGLRITPPPYTRLPIRDIDSLDAKVPAGSRIDFGLRLAAAPTAAALQFQEERELTLSRDGATWRATRTFDDSTLYRVQVQPSPAVVEPLHRIDVTPDHAPQITVHEPTQTLTVLTAEQKTWDLEFEASDDYGLVAAELSIALAQGSGENIKTSERVIELQGAGDEHRRTYRKRLDLRELGFAVGDDLIVRLTVSDNQPQAPNRTQSASFILRWPAPEESAGEGLQGISQKIIPAYFSSERQLIIDTEALLAEQPKLSATRYEARADDLGVQQKVLRLRYGQFLGEEFENNAEHAPPGVADHSQANAALKNVPPDSSGPATSPEKFGETGSLMSDYGHVHDKAEAATLLDPDTRRILKLALDEMWQAELHLRQADLQAALPPEYKALGYIKEVQQAERIYLARVGVALPDVDAARRLTGERAGLSDRDGKVAAADPGDAQVGELWTSLTAGEPHWKAIDAWLKQRRASLPDGLEFMRAADRAKRDPACAACRAELAGLFWPLLPQPPTALEPRTAPTAADSAYSNALAAPTATAP